ncbi:MAG: mismatch-specific DNA-glycosylase [Nitrospirales bacterium]
MSCIHGGLPDHLAPGLSILFVGINPGLRSSEVGHHYAGPSNRFWKLLYDAKLVPDRMTCQDDGRLLAYGYGLTNLIAKPTAGTKDLTQQDFLQGRDVLFEKIKHYQPHIVAVLGMSVAQVLLAPEKTRSSGNQVATERIRTGLQRMTLAGVRVYVLPNPSGRNAHYPYQVMQELFVDLRDVSLGDCPR